MEEIRLFLLHLEGIFRHFQGSVSRDQSSVLKAVADVVESAEVVGNLDVLVDATIFNRGDHLVKTAGDDRSVLVALGNAAPANDSLAGEAPAPPGDMGVRTPNYWYIFTAQALSKIKKAIQHELLDRKMMWRCAFCILTPSRPRLSSH